MKTFLASEGEVGRSELAKDLGIIFDIEGVPDDPVDPELDDEVAPGASREQARIDRYLEDAIRQIERRSVDFSRFYPFRLSEDRRTLRKLPSSKSRDTYLAFLLASCKGWVGEGRTIEDVFEELSFHAVRAWLGDEFEVHSCGTAATGGSRYHPQSLATKLSLLKSDLSASIVPGGGDHFRPGDSGDGGLDVVAWNSPSDSSNGTLAVFTQATTSPTFESKWNDVSPERWRQMLFMKSYPVGVLTIPFAFRKIDGDWYMPAEVQSILLDRLRLVRLLGYKQSATCHTLIDKFI